MEVHTVTEIARANEKVKEGFSQITVVGWLDARLPASARLAVSSIQPRRRSTPARVGAITFFSWFTVVIVGSVAACVTPARGPTGGEVTPTFVTTIPRGYRDWRLISVAREEGNLDDVRAILGNDVAIEAYREGKLPFPDGAILARLAWSYVASEENNKVFGGHQSFVAGEPKNGVQLMVKDSKKYAATGGWGFGQFDDGKPAGETKLKTCFPCHQALESRDLVFTRYAP